VPTAQIIEAQRGGRRTTRWVSERKNVRVLKAHTIGMTVDHFSAISPIPKNQRIPAGFNKNSETIMNEIIAWNGSILLNPSGIRKHFHVLTQGVGIRLDPVLSCMDPAGIEDTVPRN